jgi:hypothetical protein
MRGQKIAKIAPTTAKITPANRKAPRLLHTLRFISLRPLMGESGEKKLLLSAKMQSKKSTNSEEIENSSKQVFAVDCRMQLDALRLRCRGFLGDLGHRRGVNTFMCVASVTVTSLAINSCHLTII